MKVLTLLGSPHKKGNTATVLGWIEDELRNAGHVVERVHVGDAAIAPCVACNACKKVPDAPGCALKDGGNELFDRLLKSDAIVLASPIYCWGVTAQMKAVIDRAYCLLKYDAQGEYEVLGQGKKVALVATGGGEIAGNLDLLVPPYQTFVRFFQGRDLGHLLVPFCTRKEELGEKVEREAHAFALRF